ncbi:MAG: glycosyltransferase family A protein [Phycisphaerae bacterium]
MKRPNVTIVIPTYNRSSLLPRALHSVLRQTVSDWEVLVIDDGSIDDTPEVVRHLATRFGGRLQYVRRPHGGASAARNAGIDRARGRFVAFLDSDDVFGPTKLERQLALFALRPELGLVYSDFSAINLEGQCIPSAFCANCRNARSVHTFEVAPGLFVCGDDLFAALLHEYFIATIVGLVRREVLGRDVRFREDKRYEEEWLFYLEVVRRCRAGFVDEPLSCHYHVRGSLSRSDKRANAAGDYAIVREMAATFPDLSSSERATLKRHLVRTARQVGFDALRGGDHDLALRRFAEALRLRWSGRAVRELVAALAHWCWARAGVGIGSDRRVAAPKPEPMRPGPKGVGWREAEARRIEWAARSSRNRATQGAVRVT